ncbi:MAG: ATP-binding cassette domain-containing protein [Haloferacaceae archaeon]
MTGAVVAEDVTKRYGDTVALDGVTLSVDAGEVFTLVGPNGAGKTTLVRTLTGTTTPDSGTVTVLETSPREIDQERISVLPQSFTPPERLTARELLTYYAGLYEDPRPIEDVLAAVGLEGADDTWYANLSGGQQRRVCVGISLVNDPDLLFLDEPTTGIDPAGRQALWSLVTDLAAGGTTIFLTTHYMEEAEELADRVALLDSGSIVESGPPTDLVESFGGGTHLRVETAAPAPDVEALGIDVERTDAGFRVPNVSPADLGEIVGRLDDRGIEYETLTWTEPSLEDVYLRLTGERVDERASAERPLAAAGGNE